jgi:deoxyribodipyrimidine photo-lyase
MVILKQVVLEHISIGIFNWFRYELRKIGSGLLILKGKPKIEILKLQRNIKHKSFAKREVAYEESKPKREYKKHYLKYVVSWEIKHKYDVSCRRSSFAIKNIPDVLRSLEEKQN